MAFFNELIRTIEQSPSPERARAQVRSAAVLQYAPRRLRADKAEAAAAKAEAKAEMDIAYWRSRAMAAEAQLITLEARVRRLASMARRHS